MAEIIGASYRDILKKLEDAGYKAYLVGGAVRNAYLGIPAKDYDIVCSAEPEEVLSLFPGSKIINAAFSVSTYVPSSEEGGYVEVTTMRSESDSDYSNGKPVKYHFTDIIEEDLSRRDATINAIAMDYNGNVIDPFDGRQHIKERKVVAIGDPVDRIIAHPIRMMRYARFGTGIGGMLFQIDEDLAKAITDNRRLLVTESWGAIGPEFMKGLDGMAAKYILTLKHLGLLDIILPEVYETIGIYQNIHHGPNSVFMHTLKALTAADKLKSSKYEKLGVLLHDVGKPSTKVYKGEAYGYSFHKHEVVGARIAEDICKRLGVPEHERQLVVLAVKMHMYRIRTEREAKRFLRRMDIGGNSSKSDIAERTLFAMTVRISDSMAHKDEDAENKQVAALEMVTDILKQEKPFGISDLAVNGNDVMGKLGVKPGRIVGTVLEHLLGEIINENVENEREALLNEAARAFPTMAERDG